MSLIDDWEDIAAQPEFSLLPEDKKKQERGNFFVNSVLPGLQQKFGAGFNKEIALNAAQQFKDNTSLGVGFSIDADQEVATPDLTQPIGGAEPLSTDVAEQPVVDTLKLEEDAKKEALARGELTPEQVELLGKPERVIPQKVIPELRAPEDPKALIPSEKPEDIAKTQQLAQEVELQEKKEILKVAPPNLLELLGAVTGGIFESVGGQFSPPTGRQKLVSEASGAGQLGRMFGNLAGTVGQAILAAPALMRKLAGLKSPLAKSVLARTAISGGVTVIQNVELKEKDKKC